MFDLKNISAGFIEIEVRGPNDVFETVIDDFDDDLRKISKFVASLIAGNYPSDFLSDYSNCLWSYSEGGNSGTGIFSLHRKFDPLARDILSETTIEICRSDLINALNGLAKDIAFHDNFARGYLFFACPGDPRQDDFFNVVDREWEEGVKAGLFPDDIDLKDAYEDRRFIEEFPLTEPEAAILKENQEMLLSTIPEKPGILTA
ncbi:hypothetical protein HWX16_05230 [Ochrobactrum intermedium]|uniref:hypothetical protein n=1 Tax=Brucella intermedia TaxID=94625 RepID=UPI00159C0A11|nr:hypothetical protein [Brucella intermedia]MCB4919349.1 hypothetical protein [Brucella intermedia]NVM39723.1 hypothetical protein [Brucella intermedia]